jgi:cytochrome c oxidase subunit 3
MAAETETDMATASTAGQPSLTAVFFSIYYAITGLHAVHIIAGMLVLTWLLGRAVKGHFNEDYFGPVDYVGLYWHLVDLIWIYLFPLLYLIH